MSDKLRILQKDFDDGRVIYVLEKQPNGAGEWVSVFADKDLEVIREAKKKRESNLVSAKVIE